MSMRTFIITIILTSMFRIIIIDILRLSHQPKEYLQKEIVVVLYQLVVPIDRPEYRSPYHDKTDLNDPLRCDYVIVLLLVDAGHKPPINIHLLRRVYFLQVRAFSRITPIFRIF